MPIAFANFLSNGFIGDYFLNNQSDKNALIFMIIGAVIVGICAYLLGSINFAIIISGKKFKEDIRSHGSKNAGMTNMMRTYGKRAAGLTLAGDALKAVVACLIGYALIGQPGAYVAGLFCMLGHVFPIFYGFKGGKGVVTAFATVLMCDPHILPLLLLIFVIIVAFTKFISLGSIMCMLLYPLLLDRITRIITGETSPYIIFTVLIAVIIFIKHWENVKRLLNGTENKFSFKKKARPATENAEEIKDKEN